MPSTSWGVDGHNMLWDVRGRVMFLSTRGRVVRVGRVGRVGGVWGVCGTCVGRVGRMGRRVGRVGRRVGRVGHMLWDVMFSINLMSKDHVDVCDVMSSTSWEHWHSHSSTCAGRNIAEFRPPQSGSSRDSPILTTEKTSARPLPPRRRPPPPNPPPPRRRRPQKHSPSLPPQRPPPRPRRNHHHHRRRLRPHPRRRRPRRRRRRQTAPVCRPSHPATRGSGAISTRFPMRVRSGQRGRWVVSTISMSCLRRWGGGAEWEA